jgi:membrane peptidoglycan carboxypeptidase
MRAIGRALLVNLRLRAPAQGASTISQQLIRSTFLTRKKTLERKVQELILTLELERRYSKDEILGFYLNQIPLGANAYGVGAGAATYFDKKVGDLTLEEAAALAAMIKAPSYYSPYGTHLEQLLARKNYVLSRMEKEGYLSKEEAEKAYKQKVVFAGSSLGLKAPHFVLWVLDELLQTYGEDFVRENGLRVTTSLDWNLQEAAERIVRDIAKRNESLHAYNAALVAIDPFSGEVKAMVGSKDWFAESSPEGCTPGIDCLFDPKLNVATTIPGRQPGSAFKPFAYTVAFNKGHDESFVVTDEETNFGIWGDKEYVPQNYDGKFRGPVTLRQALSQSLNIPSIKVLLNLAGIQESIALARDFGLTTLSPDASLYGPSLVLGGGEVRLLDMVSAYGVFATEGNRVPPLSIVEVTDVKGRILEENKNVPLRVLASPVAKLITNILSDNTARAPIFGANSLLYFPEVQVAAKTGTTQEFRDGWVIGYTPKGSGQAIVVGVWVGNNDNSSMDKEPGIVIAGPIWREFMNVALRP